MSRYFDDEAWFDRLPARDQERVIQDMAARDRKEQWLRYKASHQEMAQARSRVRGRSKEATSSSSSSSSERSPTPEKKVRPRSSSPDRRIVVQRRAEPAPETRFVPPREWSGERERPQKPKHRAGKKHREKQAARRAPKETSKRSSFDFDNYVSRSDQRKEREEREASREKTPVDAH